jgi:hypothetical protein
MTPAQALYLSISLDRVKIALLALLGVAFVARVGLLTIYPSLPLLQWLVEGTDAAGYMQLSQNLLWTQSFHFDAGAATAYRMPGYPIFLVFSYALWQSLLPTQILQIAIDVLVVFVTYQIAKHISVSPATPFLAAAVVALHPLVMVTSLSIRPETLSVFSLTLTILLLLRAPNSIRAGVVTALLLAVAVYLKHALILAALVLLVAFTLRLLLVCTVRRVGVAAWIPLCLLLLLLAPWVARNYVALGAFVPLTTSSGSNLYGGNNPQADGGYVSAEPYVLPHVTEVESDRILKERAVSWVQSNPLAYMKLLPLKVARLFWPLSLGTSGSIEVPAILFWPILIMTLTCYSLVLYGALRLALARHYWELLLLITIPLTLVFATLFTFGAARFLLPAIPVLAVLASKSLEVMPAPTDAATSGSFEGVSLPPANALNTFNKSGIDTLYMGDYVLRKG